MAGARRLRLGLVLIAAIAGGGAASGATTEECPPELSADYARPFRLLRVDAAGGAAEFAGIQEAIDSTVGAGCRSRVEILVAPGRYREQVVIPPGAPPLILRGLGDSPSDVILEADLAGHIPRHPDERIATLHVVSDDHIISNLAVVNRRVKLWEGDRASPAAWVEGDRIIFTNVYFLNWGSDVVASIWGRHYFHDCRIEARTRGTDFIYGTAQTVFRGCRIKIQWSGLQLVAHARNLEEIPPPDSQQVRTSSGFVFSRSRVETGPGTEAFLGRPWSGDARIVFMNSWLGPGIRPEGWTTKGVREHETTAYFAEFGNLGPGADTSRRVAWAHRLTAEEAKAFRTERFLLDPAGESDPWLEYVLELEREGE